MAGTTPEEIFSEAGQGRCVFTITVNLVEMIRKAPDNF